MLPIAQCPQCGAARPGDRTCSDDFDQMLYWENENPENQAVHHLSVLCFHIQHPDLYSPQGLAEGKRLLIDFVEGGLTTEEVRLRSRASLDSRNRTWKIKGAPDAHGSHARPVAWPMTAADVVLGGEAGYLINVRRWAQVTLDALRETGNLTRR